MKDITKADIGGFVKRQTTRWRYRRNFLGGKYLAVGVIHNSSRDQKSPRDTIRLQCNWVDEDVDWALRPDEAVDMAIGLLTAVGGQLDVAEITRQRREGKKGPWK